MTVVCDAQVRLDGEHVLVIEDHTCVADAIGQALRQRGAAVTLLPPRDATAAAAVVGSRGARLVVLDLDLGTGTPGEALVPALRAAGAQVVVLTGCEDPGRLSRALRVGAAAVVSKADPLDRVVAALAACAGGTAAMPAESVAALHRVAARLEREATERLRPFAALTPREDAVLEHLMAGRTVAEIAGLEYVSVDTVRSHVRGVLLKLGVRTQLAAVAAARQAGWPG